MRPVDLLAGVENEPAFLAINPAGFIPAIQDGDVTMVESHASASVTVTSVLSMHVTIRGIGGRRYEPLNEN